MKANETEWVHCSINLSIYASFIFDTCERVVQGRAKAFKLKGALPEFGSELRQLAESALESYRLATGVLRETIRLSAAELKSSGIVH